MKTFKLLLMELASDKKKGGGGEPRKFAYCVIIRKKNHRDQDGKWFHGPKDDYEWAKGHGTTSKAKAIDNAWFDNRHPLKDDRETYIPIHVDMANKLLGAKD